MSEIVLSNPSNQYVAEYPTGSVVPNFDPAMVQQKSNSSTTSSPPNAYEETSQQTYGAYPDYSFQQMPLQYPAQPVPVTYPVGRFGYYGEHALQHPSARHHPGSPDSLSSSTSPQTPPPANTASAPVGGSMATADSSNGNNFSQILTTQALDQSSSAQMVTPLVPSSTFTNSTTERVKETIARANSVPMEFYHTEFLEYSKETYEKKMDAKRNKRKRPAPSTSSSTSTSATSSSISNSDGASNNGSSEDLSSKKKRSMEADKDESDDEADDASKTDAEASGITNAELRRQIHIQSEQKRRAQIKDGFDELRKHLPGCNIKKMSKAALLTRTVQQIQHLKNMQNELLAEVERLVQENETLKKFQHGVLQRQAMEKMYTF